MIYKGKHSVSTTANFLKAWFFGVTDSMMVTVHMISMLGHAKAMDIYCNAPFISVPLPWLQ